MDQQYLGALEKASNDIPRTINRRLVLDLIRRMQPISRADLARESGLQPSTISLIVEELIADNWVVEGQREHLPFGRRPTLLRLCERRGVIVVDLHPGRAVLAIGDIDGSLGARKVVSLSEKPPLASRQLAGAVRRLIRANPDRLLIGIGMSVPGAVDDSQKLIFAPNLMASDFDFRNALERKTGLRVEMENAANVCLLGELWFRGVGEARHLALVAVAEGIGVGVVANGRLIRGLGGLAGEIGHMIMDEGGPKCHCGARGCWEVYGSNRAALRYYKALGGHSSTDSFEKLLQLAGEGDPLGIKALEEMAFHLGRGLRILLTAYSPEKIIVAGELTAQWGYFAPTLERALRRYCLAGIMPQLIPSQDGALSRLRGGVALVLGR